MMSKTVLVKTYPASGRPNQFVVVDDNSEEIKRLEEGYGFWVIATGKDSGYHIHKAWDEYTYTDGQGYTQWRN
ncbi:MAG: hypothetical protein GF334_00240 [Candidatus Altiarchaeales archaeon]|nr:hypothetical protein [Candidatus Altiarchaeales archaeon]